MSLDLPLVPGCVLLVGACVVIKLLETEVGESWVDLCPSLAVDTSGRDSSVVEGSCLGFAVVGSCLGFSVVGSNLVLAVVGSCLGFSVVGSCLGLAVIGSNLLLVVVGSCL